MPAWLDWFTIMLLSWATPCCIFNTLRWPRITSSLVFRSLPLPLCPSTTTSLLYPAVCPFFQHVQTTSVYPFVCSFLCLTTSTRQKTLYPSVSHYTSTLLPSCHFFPALSSSLSLPMSHHYREQHLPFVRSENSQNFFQSHSSSHNAFFNTTSCTNHIS